MTTTRTVEIESLKEIVETRMEAMKANVESAVDRLLAASERLRADNEKHRADNERVIGDIRTTIERNAKFLVVQMVVLFGVAVGVAGLLIKVEQ
ncbi:MAG: hypothetical protein OXF05_06935 [Hyphomicrobiales bacterium]|nr:hypothetical protein [Hyphomicrobiales bacterium]MCY4033447.1 hypothetical protein [Hyphomicrobiales bacterium]MCY4039455.1 hypothetical protein [Hyphomicrobiales bacterium]